MTALWGALAAAALLWPGRVSGIFDGVPLDRLPEAVTVGAAFPLLLLLNPRYLRTRTARTVILSLLSWHTFGSAALVQDG